MRFVKISSPEPVVGYLTATISRHLAERERVLWLVPGGSAIDVAAAVSSKLAGQDLSRLTVTLTDERYGEVGHTDSNWRQLEEAGFLLPGARLRPVLGGAGMDQTVSHFAGLLEEELEECDYSLGFFGIGPDGHTAGILPGSPAVTARDFAEGYDGGRFQRVTMTPPAVAKLAEAVVYAVGEAKWPVLDQLDADLPLDQQPAQSLKQIHSVTIFNDHKGEQP